MANRIIDRWMWTRAFDLLSEMEREGRHLFDLTAEASSYAWQAPVDVFERNGELLVYAVLPGVTAEQVEICLQDSLLRISARRTMKVDPATAIRQLEIPYGWLERTIELPAPGYRVLEESLGNGFLFLRLGHE